MAEHGTSAVLALLQQLDAEFTTSALTTVELLSAISRLLSTRQISQAAASDAILRIEAELASFQVLDVSPELLAVAKRVVEQNQLRTLDALQCATAMLVQQAAGSDTTVVFVAADRKLLAAAEANGLTTLNPADTSTP